MMTLQELSDALLNFNFLTMRHKHANLNHCELEELKKLQQVRIQSFSLSEERIPDQGEKIAAWNKEALDIAMEALQQCSKYHPLYDTPVKGPQEIAKEALKRIVVL